LRCAVYEDFVLSVDFFGFNSLFEMPMASLLNAPAGRSRVSILCLRCKYQVGYQNAVSKYRGFNSLFEMQLFNAARPDSFISVSILCLRCAGPRGRGPGVPM